MRIRYTLLFLMLFSIACYAHTGSLVGSVKDGSNGEPLIGATIKLMDSTAIVKGVVTDAFGKFRMDKVLTGTYTLEISYVGFPDFKDSRSGFHILISS